MKPRPDGTFFVSTPIYYVNDVPHIGHAYTTIAADAMARYRRMRGDDVFFLTGTDEHGQKIEKAAAGRGVSPQALVDELSASFKTLWADLHITHDDYIRTTESRHKKAVHEIFRRMKDNGDIYEGKYEGQYCVPCESFWTDTQLLNGRCPDCGREVETVTESSYFFKLSAYGDKLLAHIQANPAFISPPSRKNEVLKFIEMGLNDLSISRTGVKWGIPVPDDPDHTIYVWLDALVNYLTATGFPDPGYEKTWPADVHIIGKDILRFHAVFWPAFLISAGLPLPKRIVSHGWWTIDGEKMSKSRGNVIDPKAVADAFGVDALRYFVLKEVIFGNDGDFSITRMTENYNTDLANGIGNLLSRTVSMVHKYRGGIVPGGGAPADAETVKAAAALPELFRQALDDPDGKGRGLVFSEPLEGIRSLVSAANGYIHEAAPWTLAKEDNDAALDTVLYNAVEALRIAGIYLAPFMPETASRIATAIGLSETPADFDDAASWGQYPAGTSLPAPTPLFPRIDPKKLPDSLTIHPEETQPLTSGTPKAEDNKQAPEDSFISIHDFAKVELKVGTVREAEAVKKSEKLLKLQIDVGEEAPRQVVAGLARQFPPEEMVGKQVVVVTNLRPAKLMGIESQGMVLATGAEQVEALLQPSGPVAPGARVR